jgi:hypothetical protein
MKNSQEIKTTEKQFTDFVYQDIFDEHKNLYNVIQKTLPKIPLNQVEKTKNKDNLKLLLDEAKNISDDEMQEYISSIIAFEYNNPNSISRKTIRVLQSMTKEEFKMFEKYSGLFWDSYFIPNIRDLPMYGNDFFLGEISDLRDLGILNLVESSEFFIYKKDDTRLFRLCNVDYRFLLTKENIELTKLSKITQAGYELMQFVHPKPNQDYINWSINWFKKQGFEKC